MHINQKTIVLISLIKNAIERCNNQYQRILQIMPTAQAKDLPVLFGDIHFFFIAATNLKKTLRALADMFPQDTALKAIYDNHLPILDLLTDLRNHLEHILDGRLDGMGKNGKVPLTDPSMLGNLFNDEYDFGGQKVNLKNAAQEIQNIAEEMKAWNEKTRITPVW